MAATPHFPPGYLEADRANEIWGVEITFFVVSLACVALRLLSRVKTNQKLWWDDWLIVGAWLMTISQTTLTILMIKHGFGKHIEAAGVDGAFFFFKSLKAHEFLYAWVVGPAKLSVLFYFYRIFGVHRTFLIPFWILCVMIILWTLAIQIVAASECKPFDAFWNRILNPAYGHCINTGDFYTGVTVPNLVTDGFLWALPIFYIYGLQLSSAKKLGLMLAFGVGSFVMIVSGLRLRAVLQYQNTTDATCESRAHCLELLPEQSLTLTPADDFVTVFVWTALEEQFAIICACLPSIAPLIRMSYRHLTSAKSTSTSQKYYNSNSNSAGSGSQKLDGQFKRLTDVESNGTHSQNGTSSQKDVMPETYELKNAHSAEQL
ncbi:MAG: hypothetical protein M1828_003453 [Chrysothrix sp. TS-e1954]|nr:MAG: hypothetical protein M1828_003453 [Chrysothrix sp. TS-e1954]